MLPFRTPTEVKVARVVEARAAAEAKAVEILAPVQVRVGEVVGRSEKRL